MILDLLFPNRCIHCNRTIGGQQIVCAFCLDKISFLHEGMAAHEELAQRCRLLFPAKNTMALMKFEAGGLSQEIIHELKYRKREKIGKTLAEWALQKLDISAVNADFIATVPLHPKKLKARGYNQLSLFASTISKATGIPYREKLIRRNFYKSAQAQKNRLARTETGQLFTVTEPVNNSHILLIDDVLTTGNTIASVAWELLRERTNTVSILVMAVD